MFKLITIGEEEYRLRLTLNSLAEFKAITGKGFLNALERENFDINEILALFHLALKSSKSYKKTLEHSGDLAQQYMDENEMDFDGFGTLISELIEGAMGLGKKKKKSN